MDSKETINNQKEPKVFKKESLVLSSDKKKEVINLLSFNRLESNKQDELIKNTLEKLYGGNLAVTKKYVLKCIKLTFSRDDDEIYLPMNLKVEKRQNELIFEFKQKKPVSIIILIIAAMIFIAIGATFSAITLLSRTNLNKDIDGDGIADINIDIDGDEIADINIDINDDDIPDINIDYKGNRMAIFNKDVAGNLVATYNLINQDTNQDGKCDLNCDLDGDGWPDINIDYYGESIANLDIDTDNDKVPDLNIDTNGDHICDVNCDTDNDGICDEFCIKALTHVPGSGTSIDTGGNPNVDSSTVNVLLIYNSGEAVDTKGLYPDDQPDYEPMPDKIITVENTSSYPAIYSLRWRVVTNTFISNNFKYKVVATNGGVGFDWRTAPKDTMVFVNKVIIPPKTVQKYTISMKLQGLNQPQNYDQGKKFIGYVEAFIPND